MELHGNEEFSISLLIRRGKLCTKIEVWTLPLKDFLLCTVSQKFTSSVTVTSRFATALYCPSDR